MLEKYNKYKLLKIFLFNPTENFRLRELSRISKISPPSVMNYLKEFESQDLIQKFSKRDVPYYRAEIDNPKFKEYRKLSVLFELSNSGLIDYLWEELSPKAIVLYGSYSKGESIEESDLDLFILGREKKIDTSKFEKSLNMNVHLNFYENFKTMSTELKNNIINGIVLKGYLKVF